MVIFRRLAITIGEYLSAIHRVEIGGSRWGIIPATIPAPHSSKKTKERKEERSKKKAEQEQEKETYRR